jgi:transposase
VPAMTDAETIAEALENLAWMVRTYAKESDYEFEISHLDDELRTMRTTLDIRYKPEVAERINDCMSCYEETSASGEPG